MLLLLTALLGVIVAVRVLSPAAARRAATLPPREADPTALSTALCLAKGRAMAEWSRRYRYDTTHGPWSSDQRCVACGHTMLAIHANRWLCPRTESATGLTTYEAWVLSGAEERWERAFRAAR